jgi:O-antigen/teichoic acid export membrane protein
MMGAMSEATPDAMQPDQDILRSGEAGGQVIRGGMVRAGGYGVSVLLSVAISAILLRHLGVEQFGQYGTIAAIAGIVLGITDAGLTSIGAREISLLPLGQQRERLASTLLVVRLVTTTLGVLVAIAFTLIAYSSTLSIGMALVGLSVILISVQSMATVPLFVSLRVIPLTAFEVARQVMTLVAIALLAIAGAGLVPFFAVQIPVSLLLLIATLIYVRQTFALSFVLDKQLIRDVVVKTLPMSAAVAMNILYLGAMVVVVSLISSEYDTGLFVTSARIMEVLILLPGITMNLALPVLSVASAEDHGRLSAALQKMVEVGFLVSSTIVVGIVVMAPVVIVLLGGPSYEPASAILRVQVLAIVGAFMTQTMQYALISLHRQRALIVTNAVALVCVIVGGTGLTIAFGPKGAAAAVVIAEALLATTMWIALHRSAPDVHLHLRFLLRLVIAVAAGLAVGLLIPISAWITGPLAIVVVLAVAFALRVFPPELFVATFSPLMGHDEARAFVTRRYGA